LRGCVGFLQALTEEGEAEGRAVDHNPHRETVKNSRRSAVEIH
jgi:hypothetical protein